MKITERLKVMLKNILSIKMGEVNTDKGRLVWDGEEDLKAGDEVFQIGEDNEPQPAADGEYITEDGKTIVVTEGKVAEIKDPEAEVAPETEEPVEETVEAAEETPEAEPADEPEAEPAEEISIEDRIAAVEGKIAEIIDGLNAIVNSIAALEGRVAEVEGKLAKVEAPAAEPVDEEPISENETPKTKLSCMRKK